MQVYVKRNKTDGRTNESLLSLMIKQRFLLFMSLPFVIWAIVFNYIPIWGWIMAFQRYIPGRSFFEQKWVYLKNFQEVFTDPRFYGVLRNTLAMSFLHLLFSFTVPIVFAILLNEIMNIKFKRIVQTISYVPHFVSWVVVAGIIAKMLSIDGGIVNEILTTFHIVDKPIQFLAQGKLFWIIATLADMWKETGWSSIIYMAAISGIDIELYEAAKSDGAGRFKRIWHVTLPGIRPTIMILMIMAIGWLMSIGFEKQMLLGNSLVIDYSEVLDLYVLNYGIGMGRFSFGTAVGVFNSLVSIILLLTANGVFKKISGESLV